MGLTTPADATRLSYAGAPMTVLSSDEAAFTAAELIVPAGFRGPIPHVHDTFDEALYVIDGALMAGAGWDAPAPAPAGSMLTAPRGTRHFFANPFDEPARVLGVWSPGRDGLRFMETIGAALPASGPADPETMRELYEAHGSRLAP